MTQLIKAALLIALGIGVTLSFQFIWKCKGIAEKKIKGASIRRILDAVRAEAYYTFIEDVSPNVKLIVVILEDHNFFSHRGYDVVKIFRAFCLNVRFCEKRAGGSSITQQLAKNLYFTQEKTYTRKMAEWFVARYIEREMTKEEILELYLNIIFYGNERYDIRSACQYYFQRQPSELSLNQAITIGSILPAPMHYNPFSERRLFFRARFLALKQLCKQGILKEADVAVFQNAAFDEVLDTAVTKTYEEKIKLLYTKMAGQENDVWNRGLF